MHAQQKYSLKDLSQYPFAKEEKKIRKYGLSIFENENFSYDSWRGGTRIKSAK